MAVASAMRSALPSPGPRLVTPIVRAFGPELIVVSAGQDANVQDPLARMAVSVDGFRAMTRTMLALAEECCEGRLVVTQEGGYAPHYAPYCSAAVAEVLVADRGVRVAPFEDPYGARAETLPSSRNLGLDCERALNDALAVQRRYWPI